MKRKSATTRFKRLLLVVLASGVPLVTTVTCDPVYGALGFYRYDDYDGFGFIDVFVDDCYFDCFFF
ncbi:MAG: hypothetical protein ACE5EX_04220 [Phycisphaerae bacterium]